MALIVHKYGGTSMGSTERIRNVAKRVAKWARAGHQMVVVPSAMSGETNRLLGLAKELAPAKSSDAYRPRAGHAGRHRRAGLVRAAGHCAAGRGHGLRQLCRLAGAHQDQQRLHQGPHRIHRRQEACVPTWPRAAW
jgi:aspartokinase